MLDIVVSYHWVQFQGTKLEKMAKKPLVLDRILIHLAQIRAVTFFFENLASSFTRYYGQLS